MIGFEYALAQLPFCARLLAVRYINLNPFAYMFVWSLSKDYYSQTDFYTNPISVIKILSFLIFISMYAYRLL